MEDIKEAVGLALERKGVLSRLRAELRANVFFAIDEQEQNSGGEGLSQKTSSPQRESLLASSDGLLLFGLVRDFLECCSLYFTAQVYEPEVGLQEGFKGRSELGQQLGLFDAPSDSPLLLALLRKFQSGGSAGPTSFSAPVSAGVGAGALGPPPLRRAGLAPMGRALTPVDSEKPALLLPSSLPLLKEDALSAATAAEQDSSAYKAAAAPALRSEPSVSSLKSTSQPQAGATAVQAVSAEPSSNSYGDDPEFEVDEELGSVGVVDDDEDYAAVFGGTSSKPAVQAPAAAEMKGAAAGKREDDPGDLSLSTSGGILGLSRARRAKAGSSVAASGFGKDTHEREQEALPGDRSFNASTELGGYHAAAPQPPAHLAPLGNGGGLSTSGDIRSLDLEGRLEPLPFSVKVPLAPLAPLGGPKSLPPAKLAPLGGLKPPLVPLHAAKDDPVRAARMRLSNEDLKDELRRSGLISSDGVNSASQSMEIPDVRPSQPYQHRSASSQPVAVRSAVGLGRPPSNMFDGEMSISNSLDIGGDHEHAATVAPAAGVRQLSALPVRLSEVSTMAEEDSTISRSSFISAYGTGAGGTSIGRGGVSMDFRETGLSADDHSGELDKLSLTADMSETAELDG